MRHAKESKFIKRLRRKIKKELKQNLKNVTKAKLNVMQRLIHLQLERDSKQLQHLGKATITVFDENQHTAPTKSTAILHLQKAIQNEFSKFQERINKNATEAPALPEPKMDFSHQ